MTRRRYSRNAVVVGLFLSVIVAISFWWIHGAAANQREVSKLKIASRKIEPLHRDKSKPGPHDWLANHKERGQTFAQYARSRPNRPTRIRKVLYLQPIGDFSKTQTELVTQTAELLSRFYNVPTRVLKPLDLSVIPKEARRKNRYRATSKSSRLTCWNAS